MNIDNLNKVVEDLITKAEGMQRVASRFFYTSLLVLIGSGYLFYSIKLPIGDVSDSKYIAEIIFSLFSRFALIVISFYLVKLLMSVVSYNLALSNDLRSKANVLLLYKQDGSNKLNDINEFISVNNHKFEASKGFSGKDELSSLLSILKSIQQSSKKD